MLPKGFRYGKATQEPGEPVLTGPQNSHQGELQRDVA